MRNTHLYLETSSFPPAVTDLLGKKVEEECPVDDTLDKVATARKKKEKCDKPEKDSLNVGFYWEKSNM